MDELLAPVTRRVVAALEVGKGVARRLPGMGVAERELVRAGGAEELDATVNRARSLVHTGQLVVLIALHVSHCPQTIPISCCSSRNAIPKRRSVVDVLDKGGQATCKTGSYIRSRADVNFPSVDVRHASFFVLHARFAPEAEDNFFGAGAAVEHAVVARIVVKIEVVAE